MTNPLPSPRATFFSHRRGILLGILAAALLAACGGGQSTRLRTMTPPTGSGSVSFEVLNATDGGINSIYIADTKKVSSADWGRMAPGSPEESKLWGEDVLSAAIAAGEQAPVPVTPGRWDFRVVDKDGREQHVTGVKIGAGGKYVLELYDSGWRTRN